MILPPFQRGLGGRAPAASERAQSKPRFFRRRILKREDAVETEDSDCWSAQGRSICRKRAGAVPERRRDVPPVARNLIMVNGGFRRGAEVM